MLRLAWLLARGSPTPSRRGRHHDAGRRTPHRHAGHISKQARAGSAGSWLRQPPGALC